MKTTHRTDAMDKLGEAMQDIKGVWTNNVRNAYDVACKQFRSNKTRVKNLTAQKEVAEEFAAVLHSVYVKLGLEFPKEFYSKEESHKVLAKIELLKQGQRLSS
ncbi:hypothetical protein [Flavobacterium sp.]|jgi:hypothetical protein|uniref:hypothetical protein n=1 Tax=Flavobacterium sp. TaxID=239 RepID=UPI0037BF7B37